MSNVKPDPPGLRAATRTRSPWVFASIVVAIAAAATAIATTRDATDGGDDHSQGADPSPTSVVDVEPSDPASMLLVLLDDDRSLDGRGNQLADPTRGAVDQPFSRLAAARYADDISAVDGDRPAERYLSNRVFNDTNQDLFSENGVTHWGFVWGQFIDHTISLSEAGGDDDDDPVNDVAVDGLVPMKWNPADPLEMSPNALGIAHTFRSVTADGTGADTTMPAEQINELSSYIDAFNVYGGTAERLDWLREGSADGDPTNNSATLLMADGYLPTALERPGAAAPDMDVMGRLRYDPSPTVVAGDERANENIGLTAVHTLFVREHNRIVGALPDTLDSETKFAIARRVIAATEQYITYEDFLPAMGVNLDDYAGYDPAVDASITNEFATVGFRAHSQIPSSLVAEVPAEQITDRLLDRFAEQGVHVDDRGAASRIAVPLNVAFGNPGLLIEIGLGNLAAGLAGEVQRANDEQIDDQLRSVLFQIPDPSVGNPLDCLDEAKIDSCFLTVNDLGSLDVYRTYDHGIASYNDLREAYGLARATSFTALTGEDTDQLPDGLTIDDPAILDVVALFDAAGDPLALDSGDVGTAPVTAVRRSTLAARLAAIFATVDDVDAFTGMVSEPHVASTEFGELQLALWTQQFQALRDGDRYFYANDPALELIVDLYGIDYRRTLADVIADNTSLTRADLPASAFLVDT